jgi:hypothetical protein
LFLKEAMLKPLEALNNHWELFTGLKGIEEANLY